MADTTLLFKQFFNSEKTGGIILIICTIVSLIISNTDLAESYHHLWNAEFANNSIEHWINDGLMAIFFLLVGLELKRELLTGELSNIQKALFPAFGALGGMIIPAAIFLAFNFGTETQSGAGIPMATDIAFALGVLSLLGNKVPVSLKIFLTAFAVIDDLGAILVIAIFYTKTLSFTNLLIALAVFISMLRLNKLKVKSLIPYLLGGVVMWYFMLHSGIHATISGVLLAFAIPFENGTQTSASFRLQHWLHKPVTFVILPLFALANTAISVNGNIANTLNESYSIGVAAGLMIGKPLGILLFTFTAAQLKICSLPSSLKWKHISGAGVLGGIGFTMSIFITLLAYDNAEIISNTKLVILLSSLIAAIVGLMVLKGTLSDEIK